MWSGLVAGAIVVGGSGCRRSEAAERLESIGPALDALRTGAGSMAERMRLSPPEPPWTAQDDSIPATLEEDRAELLRKLKERLHVSDAALEELRKIFAKAPRLGQGNPKVTEHPMTRAECRAIRAKAALKPASAICGEPNMVAIYAREKGETESDATVCIDQFEFPNIACEYPVTWVQAFQAQLICKALGKRMCDAHEWEGACYGDLRPPQEEYAWNLERANMSGIHNMNNVKNGWVRWAYGPVKDHKKCATTGHKSDKCVASEYERCGSNTFPAGAFPECVSVFGVYDQHGNAAEHMSLPMKPSELGAAGGIGHTEMKGSWFIFNSYEAHEDDCRWRAPDWHGSRVMDPNSHANYHLGFRCCKDIKK